MSKNNKNVRFDKYNDNDYESYDEQAEEIYRDEPVRETKDRENSKKYKNLRSHRQGSRIRPSF